MVWQWILPSEEADWVWICWCWCKYAVFKTFSWSAKGGTTIQIKRTTEKILSKGTLLSPFHNNIFRTVSTYNGKSFCFWQAYSRVLDKPFTEVREAGICMRENPFYVDTVRRCVAFVITYYQSYSWLTLRFVSFEGVYK